VRETAVRGIALTKCRICRDIRARYSDSKILKGRARLRSGPKPKRSKGLPNFKRVLIGKRREAIRVGCINNNYLVSFKYKIPK
jgi:hypothetical protein